MQRFTSLRPAILQRWDALLRTAPSFSPLTHPDLMKSLTSDILVQLTDRLADTPAGATPADPGFERECDCGHNPLYPYYAYGRQAIEEVARPVLGRRFPTLLALYDRMAQRELAAFCGVCNVRPAGAGPARSGRG